MDRLEKLNFVFQKLELLFLLMAILGTYTSVLTQLLLKISSIGREKSGITSIVTTW